MPTGKRLHAKEKMTFADGVPRSRSEFEERSIAMASTAMALVRIVIGKVVNIARLETALRSTPVKREHPGWNCVKWVKDALEAVENDSKAVGPSKTDWNTVRNTAMRCAESKRVQHRFDGKADFDMSKVATYDMLEEQEVVP